MEKRPFDSVLNIVRILVGPLVIVSIAVAFFFTYNTYLIDNSLESLRFSLNKVSKAKTVEEAQHLKMILGEALIKEVSAEKLDTASVVSLEFSQNILSEGKINDQLKDLKLILSSVIKSKEAKRSKLLLRLDAINEKIGEMLLKAEARLYGKRARKGVEVDDLGLLDKARTLESNWQIEEAISNYNAFIKNHPTYKDMGWVYLRLGYAYLKVGNLKDAETIFDSIARDYLGEEEALIAKRFAGKAKEIRRSLKDKEILLKKLGTAKTNEEKQRLYYDIGVIDAYNYNLGSSRDFFKKVVEIDPTALLAQKAQFNIGWSLKFQNDLEKSALVFEDVITIYAKGDIVLNAKYQLADTYHKGGKFEEAIAIYKKIAQDYKDKPIAPLAQFQAGYSYLYNVNDPIQASETFKELGQEFQSSAVANYAAVDIVPTLEARFRDFAFTLLIEGKYEKSKEAFAKAIEVNKNDAWAHAGLGSSYIQLDSIEEALPSTEGAMNIIADEYTYSVYAFNLEREGKIPEAIEGYKRAISKNKEYLVAHYNLGRLYEIQARYDEAINEYKEAIRIIPNFPHAHANLAHSYWFKGEVGLCLEEYKRALEFKPAFPEVHYNLGLIFKVLGKDEEARSEFEAALLNAPKFKEAKDELEALK